MSGYTHDYFDSFGSSSLRAAEVIIPLVLQFIQPKSAIDVGCGLGTWLTVLKKNGVEDIIGIDGDYVKESALQIPHNAFIAKDLTQPINLGRQFDLAISMEVAEHLPGCCATAFVDSLTRLAPIVLFSAAIPFQGGEHHVNEQWPEYWSKLFLERGYVAIDCIRKQVWQNPNVLWCYAQNTILYVKRDYVDKYESLRKELDISGGSVLPLVHPLKYLDISDPIKMSPKRILFLLPRVIINALKRRYQRAIYNQMRGGR